jgi:hypothetical protein
MSLREAFNPAFWETFFPSLTSMGWSYAIDGFPIIFNDFNPSTRRLSITDEKDTDAQRGPGDDGALVVVFLQAPDALQQPVSRKFWQFSILRV